MDWKRPAVLASENKVLVKIVIPVLLGISRGISLSRFLEGVPLTYV